MDSSLTLPIGFYERVIDTELRKAISLLGPRFSADLKAVDEAELHAVLGEFVGQAVTRRLYEMRASSGAVVDQVALCNTVLQALEVPFSLLASELPSHLLAVTTQGLPHNTVRPATPLSQNCLLTGTRLDPSLLSQLRAEVSTADRVDILCSFVKWSGVRILENELRELTGRGDGRLRVVTSTYLGATDKKAVDFLTNLPGAQMRVSYDSARTRLHAKAYLFHRESGFGTAYIGSSNLSDAAMTDGLEWNVKISEYESPQIWQKIVATFLAYWSDDREFVPYSQNSEDMARLTASLAQERSAFGSAGFESNGDFAAHFDLRPYPFQQEILDKLEADRTLRGQHRNLVIAATGTGKTMIAAFDYRRFAASAEHGNRRPRLLFIAHREEILRQSLFTFRAVLRDANFGDLLVGSSHDPAQANHLFVSIQTYNSRKLHERFVEEWFDYVVVDEFHHAEAASYQRLLKHLRPQILLGLTATPERADGRDVFRYFDGFASAELRLPEAINRRLLCAFQYFGITDTVDFTNVEWRRGAYADSGLEKILIGNRARNAAILTAVQEKLTSVRGTRALGFCVSVAHAKHMASVFRQAGIAADFLTGDSPTKDRNAARNRLTAREINFLFVVDLYNEGVDIPEIDTVLFLRPTESLTVFLQQLGRGLRLHEGKDCLTVLDFVGQSNPKFDWQSRFRALLDRTMANRSLANEIAADFPSVPAGCSIQLERLAQQYVLDNIRRAIDSSQKNLLASIANFAEDSGELLTLAHFLDYHELSANRLYKSRVSWTRLCERAGVPYHTNNAADPDEDHFGPGLRRIAHINGRVQIERLLTLLEAIASTGDVPHTIDFSERCRLEMLFVSLFDAAVAPSVADGVSLLSHNPNHLNELCALLRWRFDRINEVSQTIELPFQTPLELHADYTRDEILIGLGYWNLAKRPAFREGVLFVREVNSDAFFVTLNKTESAYSPTTMYEDYAINERRFHWQSQSTTSVTSPTGRRYLEQSGRTTTALLFVRVDAQDANNYTNPYTFLGPVRYAEHTGSQPISIEWDLDVPIPARLFPAMLRLTNA